MDFSLTAEQRQIKEVVADFVDSTIKPQASEIDRTDTFPRELVDDMAELDLMGMPFSETYDGAGLDTQSYLLALTEISRGSGGLGTAVAAHTSLAGGMLADYGTDQQKETYLAPLNRGDEIGAFALSEAQAGSDISAIETTAEAVDDGYVMNGGKLWTSNGSIADTLIVFAKTTPNAGQDGLSSFIVRADDPGFHIEGTEDKLGDKGCPTAELRFEDLELPQNRLLGDPGEGFGHALRTLNSGRMSIAARAVGIATAAFNAALDYATEREQFGKPIADHQAIQHKLADMDTKIEAARLLMHQAADRKDRNERYVKAAAEAKLFASEVSREVANEGIQIHGGYGYVRDFPAERFYRDAKVNEIYEGTSEILRNTIARELIG